MTSAADYDFDLPKELIAQQPLSHRADARLLVVSRRDQSLEHAHVRDLPKWLRSGDCLVVNDSRVVPARLIGVRERTGGAWEGLFMRAESDGDWLLLCKTRGKLTVGETVLIRGPKGGELRVILIGRGGEGEWKARPQDSGDAFTLLRQIGRVPLPPYIRGGEMSPEDVARYQTVYADRPGSVAAPTAGLHLTSRLLEQIGTAGTAVARVTLHVGLGTFRPIQSEAIEEHVMHSERYSLTEREAGVINAAKAADGRVIAVGTTSVRVLESVASNGPVEHGPVRESSGETDLFIRPGFPFRVVDGLLTNFHLPRSTLLVLVRAFGGDELIRRAYEEAIRERYRFFSYGDAMLIV